MIRATTTRLVALRLVNPAQLCTAVGNSSLLQHATGAASRSIGTKKEIGEGMDEEKMRPGERSQVLQGILRSPRLLPPMHSSVLSDKCPRCSVPSGERHPTSTDRRAKGCCSI